MINLRRRRPQDGPLHDDREQSPIAAQTTPTRHDIDDGVSNLRIVLNIIVRRAITHRLSAAPTPIHKLFYKAADFHTSTLQLRQKRSTTAAGQNCSARLVIFPCARRLDHI